MDLSIFPFQTNQKISRETFVGNQMEYQDRYNAKITIDQFGERKLRDTLKKRYFLTDGTQGRFLELRQAAVVDGQMADVEAEEHVRLQFGQIVVPEPEIEDDSVGPSFERGHHIGDVR